MTNLLKAASDTNNPAFLPAISILLWVTVMFLLVLLYGIYLFLKHTGIVKFKFGNNEIDFNSKSKNYNNEIRMIVDKIRDSDFDMVIHIMNCAGNKIYAFGSALIEVYKDTIKVMPRYSKEINIYAVAEMKTFKNIVTIYCDRIKTLLLFEILKPGLTEYTETELKTIIDNNEENYRTKFIELVNENIWNEFCEVGAGGIITIFDNYYKVFQNSLVSIVKEAGCKDEENKCGIELYIRKFISPDFQYTE